MPGRLRIPAALAVAVLVGSCTNSNAPAPAPDAHNFARDGGGTTPDGAAPHDASVPVDAGVSDVPMG